MTDAMMGQLISLSGTGLSLTSQHLKMREELNRQKGNSMQYLHNVFNKTCRNHLVSSRFILHMIQATMKTKGIPESQKERVCSSSPSAKHKTPSQDATQKI